MSRPASSCAICAAPLTRRPQAEVLGRLACGVACAMKLTSDTLPIGRCLDCGQEALFDPRHGGGRCKRCEIARGPLVLEATDTRKAAGRG